MARKTKRRFRFPWEASSRASTQSRRSSDDPSSARGTEGPSDASSSARDTEEPSDELPAPGEGAAPEPEAPPPPTSGNIRFREENTDEYDARGMWEKGSARSHLSIGIGETVEDTREVFIQSSRKRNAQAVSEDRPAWATPPSLRGRLRVWLADDPLVLWYLSLPRTTRVRLGRIGWIVVTSVAIAVVFSVSALGVYPLVEEHVRPAFAPRPEKPERLVAREGLAFDLAEERDYPLEPFRLGTDCIWIVRNPALAWPVDPSHFELVDATGAHVADLDVRVNWDGLVRVYFGVGRLPELKPLWIRVSIAMGGLWSSVRERAWTLCRIGGVPPPFVDVGPVRFVE
ncbi:MAG: hypothetical protein FJ109_14520 [Deltaproteobacteria bacterium]|nr:hypothetical protein [Deltaproteobacteria bacterium]